MAETEQYTQSFLAWAETIAIKGVVAKCAPQERFVPYSALREWFAQDNRLVKVIREHCRPPRHDPREIARVVSQPGEGGYLRGFAILLKIGAGAHIAHFTQYDDLSDSHMPFRGTPDDFPTAYTTKPGEPPLLDRFRHQQWAFFPEKMDSRPSKQVTAERILPIFPRDNLGSGHSAQTKMIEIHAEYNHLKTNTASEPQSDVYVLKTYYPQNAGQYQAEKRAYTKLQSSRQAKVDSFLKFYGSFEHTGFDEQTTFNVILEYADGGNLQQMFDNCPRPSRAQDIAIFWLRLLDTIEALAKISGVSLTSDDDDQALAGWHQDVKPENILLKCSGDSPLYRSNFKLADMGLTHFRRRTGNNSHTLDRQGDRTYGAPETYREDAFASETHLQVDSTIDVWSLGCVLLEAIVWVTGGRDSLEDFRQQRIAETKGIEDNQSIGAFHDGYGETLDCVTRRLEELDGEIRRNDNITPDVLELVCQHMLRPRDLRSLPMQVRNHWIHGGKKRAVNVAKGQGRDYTGKSVHTRRSTYDQSRRSSSPKSSSSEVLGQGDRVGSVSAPQLAHEESSASHEPSVAPTLAPRPPPPNWRREEADTWLGDRKASKAQVPDISKADQLVGRDHVFFIDNSFSMRSHWKHVAETVELLSEILFSVKADDQIDILLVSLADGSTRKKKSKDLREFVLSKTPPEVEGRTLNPEFALDRFLSAYIERLASKSAIPWNRTKDRKPLSIYLLTDGRYLSKANLMNPIKKWLAARDQMRKDKHFVGLQLIQCGDDAEGRVRLQELDNYFREEQDIVDTEPAKGNVWKMLLGGIDDSYDDDDYDCFSLARPRSEPNEDNSSPMPGPGRQQTHYSSVPDRSNTVRASNMDPQKRKTWLFGRSSTSGA